LGRWIRGIFFDFLIRVPAKILYFSRAIDVDYFIVGVSWQFGDNLGSNSGLEPGYLILWQYD
jgi:hypothetical protein